jgi:hypothetical protein
VIAPKLTLAADGTFAVKLRPAENRTYRLATQTRTVSPRWTVFVHPALALTHSGGAFHASMFPALAGATLVLQHYAAGWHGVERATVGVHGNVRFHTALARGQWRVAYAGDPRHAAARSPVVILPAMTHFRRK